MKNINEFLSYCHSLNIKFWISEDNLRYKAPKGTLTSELLTQIKEYKLELIELLQKGDFSSSFDSQSINPVPRDHHLPVSFTQQGVWFLQQMDTTSAVANMCTLVKISGSLQVSALEQSFREVIQRHEVLRTTLKNVDGQLTQVISHSVSFTLPLVDLRYLLYETLRERSASLREALPTLTLSQVQQEKEIQRLATEIACQGFNLSDDLLLRSMILHLDTTEYIMLLVVHHIVGDGWSMGVFKRDLSAFYNAFTTGSPLCLPELPIQYADFAIWQRQYLKGEVLAKLLYYWQRKLEGASTFLALPTDRPRLATQSFIAKIQSFKLSNTLTKSVKTLTHKTGTTLFMLLLATFKTLLYRYTGQEDILVGSPIANRERLETENVMGCFVNTLVLRTNLSSQLTFEELLNQVRETTLEAYAHQDLPYEKLVEEILPTRHSMYAPFFQVVFVLQNAFSAKNIEFTNLKVQASPIYAKTTLFDLNLEFTEQEDGLIGNLTYNADIFYDSTIARIIENYQTLLTGVIANPNQQLLSLPLLTQTEKQQILQWNQNIVDYSQPICIHQLFEAQVEQTPDAVAVVFEGEQLTYQQLNQKANQLAHYLQKVGVKPEMLIGICFERSIELMIGVIGILKAGGAYVPIDPQLPQERLRFILKDTNINILVVQNGLLNIFPDFTGSIISLEDTKQESKLNPVSEVKENNLAYVIYTSGSTGKPKGVLVNHLNVVRLFSATDNWFKFNQNDVWTLFHSYAFDFSVWEMWGALLYGGRLVIVPYLVSRSPDAFYNLLRQEQVTILNQTPSAFRQLMYVDKKLHPQGDGVFGHGEKGMGHGEEVTNALCPMPQATGRLSRNTHQGMEFPVAFDEQNNDTNNDLALRLIVFGGEALEIKSLSSWFERHGDCSPQLVNMYGITETTVHVTYRPLNKADLECTNSAIGRPIPDLEVYILDQNLQLVPIGVTGEMYVGGAGVSQGYLNRPELTIERFISHPFKNNFTKIYKTGDLARYLPNGEIEYLGRIDNQVKIRGFRIELGEIEATLNTHPQIRESVVIIYSDEIISEILVAYVIPTSKDLVTAELREFLQQKLPEYMLPTNFIVLEKLPLTTNGKVDRKALPLPNISIRDSNIVFVPPRTPIEKIVANIYAEVLTVEKIGIYDNFFSLGGHSILATKVISRLRETLKVELPLRILFEEPTVARLTKYLETIHLSVSQTYRFVGKGRKEIEL